MKAVIIEDEEIISKVLQNKINKVAADVDVIAILPSLKTARRWLGENAEPDLMFMSLPATRRALAGAPRNFSLSHHPAGRLSGGESAHTRHGHGRRGSKSVGGG